MISACQVVICMLWAFKFLILGFSNVRSRILFFFGFRFVRFGDWLSKFKHGRLCYSFVYAFRFTWSDLKILESKV